MAGESVGHAVHGGASITRVVISDELRAALEALSEKKDTRTLFPTEEQKAAMLEYWPKVRKQDLAKIFGVSRSTLTRWYEELTKT